MTQALRGLAASWLARLSWTLRGRGNPLRRPVDQTEGRVIGGLLVIFLIAGPLAVLAGANLAYGASLREMRAEQSWRQVTATLVQNADDSPATSGGAWAPAALAKWTSPDGHERQGMISVDASATAGQHVTIWVVGTGRPAMSPQSKISAVLSAVTIGLSSLGLLVLLLLLAGWIVRIILNRRRLADWETEWQTVEPRWRSPR